MRVIIDRIEEKKAVVELESGKTLRVPRELFPNASDGDAVIITIEKASDKQKAQTHAMFEHLRNKSKSE